MLAAVMLGGAAAALMWPGWRRSAGVAVAVTALVATVTVETVNTPPAAPAVQLRLAVAGAPDHVPSTAAFTLCGRGASGPVAVPVGGGFLEVLVDGTAVEEIRGAQGRVSLGPGRHVVSVEMVDGGHRRYQPPVTAEMRVTVDPSAPSAAAPTSC